MRTIGETDAVSAGEQQLTRWAEYPTRTLVLRAIVAALIGAALHVLLGYLLFNRDAAFKDAVASASWFGALVLAFLSGTSLWARRRARQGRRVWWLADPDD
jgi:small-conductance mechanosensitive channel